MRGPMSYKFQNCKNRRLLRKCAIDRERVKREIAEAEHDLLSAKESLRASDMKWAIVKGYFSMFHACKSLLYSAGYDEHSHDCLIIAIEEIFVEKGLIPHEIISDIRNAKIARESADYGLTYGEATAQGVISDAEQVFQSVAEYHASHS